MRYLYLFIILLLSGCTPLLNNLGYIPKDKNEIKVIDTKPYNGKTILDVCQSEKTTFIIFTDGTIMQIEQKNKIKNESNY